MATLPATNGLRITDLNGAQRAAILVMYLDPASAKQLLDHLEPDDLEAIGMAMADVDKVSPELVEQVVAQFVKDLYGVALMPRAGREYALSVLPNLLDDDRREKVMSRLKRHISTEFQDYIATRPPATVATLLLDEHPQTQAIALLLMGPENAAIVLSYMDEEDQFDASMRMARIDQVPSELAEDVENAVRRALEDRGAGLWEVEGVDNTAQMLGQLHEDFQKPLIERIASTDLELSDLLKRRMLLFKDLVILDNKAVQTLLKGVDRQTLILALKGAEPALKELFLANMSKRAAADIRDELDILGPTPKSDVDEAQEQIVQVAMTLAEEGALRIPIGGGDEML